MRIVAYGQYCTFCRQLCLSSYPLGFVCFAYGILVRLYRRQTLPQPPPGDTRGDRRRYHVKRLICVRGVRGGFVPVRGRPPDGYDAGAVHFFV